MNDKQPFDLRIHRPLGEIVFDYLRESILKGEIKPGERLMEVAIAEKLGVSRTPVREAIRRLEKENFVRMIPRRGAFVADLTTKDIKDVLELRKELEGFASYLAAMRMDDSDKRYLKTIMEGFIESLEQKDRYGMLEKDNEFHELIFKASGNNKLIDIVLDLHDQFQRFRLIYFNEFDNYLELMTSHKKIYDAIVAQDAVEARKYAEEHILSIETIVDEWIKESGK